MEPTERKAIAKDIATELHAAQTEAAEAAAKKNKRSPYLAYGIPVILTLVVTVMGFLSKEVYEGLKEGQLTSSQTDAAQNEALAETTQVLKSLSASMIRVEGETLKNRVEIASSRQDPFTGSDGKDLYKQVSTRIGYVEGRVTNLEREQRDALVDAERIKTRITLIERSQPEAE